MNRKNTIRLFLLAIGLLAFVFFFESKRPRPIGGHLLDFSREELTGILISKDSETVELQNSEAGWQLVRPCKDRADSVALAQLLTDLETLQRQHVAGSQQKPLSKDELKEFGLKKPSLILKLVSKGAQTEISLGKDAAVEGKLYALVGPEVHVVDAALKERLLEKVDNLRDHKLSDVNPAVIDRVVIQTPEGEIEAVKRAGRWYIRKPIAARGDMERISQMIARTLQTRIDGFLEGSPEAGGLSEPRATIRFFSEGAARFSLQLGKTEKNRLYAHLDERSLTCLVAKEMEGFVTLKPNDLRERKLMRIDADTVDRIVIEPAADSKIVLARKEEQWVIKNNEGRPANAAQAQQLLETFAAEKVLAFSSDVASGLARYGLDAPSLKLTFSAFASENTAESRAGENVLNTIVFGKRDGNGIYAKLEDEPFIVKVSTGLLRKVPQGMLQWADLSIYGFNPEDLAMLEVKRPSGVQRFEKHDKTWVLTSGTGEPEMVNLQSLCNALAGLRAVRWIGPVTGEHGFSSSPTLVSFVLANGGGSKLAISGKVDEFGYGTVEDSNISFALSKPDLEVFKLPLTRPLASGVAGPGPASQGSATTSGTR